MRSRNIADFCKNALGTVFLLAGAFFVCSTLLSIRAVFADPIIEQPVITQNAVASPRANTNARANASRNSNPRANSRVTTASGRAVTARTATNQGGVITSRVAANNAAAARAKTLSSRGVTTRATATSGRGVATRAVAGTNARGTATRTVRARTATTPAGTARVSLTGSAIRGNRASSSTSYTYLQSKLYTGSYSNIIDSSTGLISADAYSNCLDSYYACMDEICTARNAAMGRCSCAARAQAFNEVEGMLEAANEELIKVSGELALLIATKGKDVSAAFKLTDAEQIMNCAAYAEVIGTNYPTSEYKTVKDAATAWCAAHPYYTGNDSGLTMDTCNETTAPTYCRTMGNQYGFKLSDLSGSGSDILATIKSWADAKDSAKGYLAKDSRSVLDAFNTVSDIVSGMGNITTGTSETATLDSIANTWGYDLFRMAHNDVCSRVLDSCFNGIYEACGSPPSGGKCATAGKNGSLTNSCPFNYNSNVKVSSDGEITLVERGTNVAGNNASAQASCFGYTASTTTSTYADPYVNLRGPVADARRSVMNKYLLDANAACDAYGQQLRATAQNIGYQKVAAQQALQQKRLEFYQEEQTTIASDYRTALNNFNECIAELYDCYTDQAAGNSTWSTSRIKSYCQTVSNAPHCYEQMVCGAPNNELLAVITVNDTKDRPCNNTIDYTTNTCRNLVTMAEIISGSYASGAQTGSATLMREQCLMSFGINGVRNWTKNQYTDNEDAEGWLDSDSRCGANMYYNNTAQKCECINDNYHEEGLSCVVNTRACDAAALAAINAESGTQSWNSTGKSWGDCVPSVCQSGYHAENKTCVLNSRNCESANATKATQTWSGNVWGTCVPTACEAGYELKSGKCEAVSKE